VFSSVGISRLLSSVGTMDEEIDLSNVDYDDVLNLYRGWRRSEGALKEKSKELNALKERMKNLQDSHVKFRSQIQALESVKELTISLQTQLSVIQQENNQLNIENRRLAQQRKEADELLSVKTKAEQESNRILRDLQLEFGTLRSKYSDMQYAQQNLRIKLDEEQALRSAAEHRLQVVSDTADTLRREVKDSKAKLDTANARLVQCDVELTHASEQLKNLALEVANMAETNNRSKTAEAEVSILKGDIARLLRLLEHYPAARKFIRHWQDSQGMSFVGMGPASVEDDIDALLQSSGGRSGIEDDDGADEEKMAAGWDDIGIYPNDLAHMKRIYSGGDTHPMTDNIDVSYCLYLQVP
jgi:chromosome segregation ATPase